jgi:hypothetical protein
MGKSAWHLHGKERGLLVSTRASDAGRLCDYASGCLLQRNCLQRRRWHPTSAPACCRVCKPRIVADILQTCPFSDGSRHFKPNRNNEPKNLVQRGWWRTVRKGNCRCCIVRRELHRLTFVGKQEAAERHASKKHREARQYHRRYVED